MITQTDPENLELLLINLNSVLTSSKNTSYPSLLMVTASNSFPTLFLENKNISATFIYSRQYMETTVYFVDAALHANKSKIICGFVNRQRENWLATLHGSLFVACQCQGALVPGLGPNCLGPWRAHTETTVPPAPEGLPRKLMRTIGMNLLQFPSVMWIPPWEGLSGHLASGEA